MGDFKDLENKYHYPKILSYPFKEDSNISKVWSNIERKSGRIIDILEELKVHWMSYSQLNYTCYR